MKNLIVISLFVIALFALMSCGFDSRPIERNLPHYDLSGKFTGIGDLYTTADENQISELKSLVENKRALDVSLEAVLDLKVLTSNRSELTSIATEKLKNKKQLKALKAKLEVDIIMMDTLSFEIEKNAETGDLELNKKPLITTQDKDEVIEPEDDADTEEDESKNDPEIRYYFGDILDVKPNPKVSHDPITGEFSFSIIVTQDKKSFEYTFYGMQKESLDDTKEIKTVTLEGLIKVTASSEKKVEEVEQKPLHVGFFQVTQAIPQKK